MASIIPESKTLQRTADRHCDSSVIPAPMKMVALVALAMAIPACGPNVEFADVTVTEPRPRPNACIAGAAPTFATTERMLLSPPPASLGPIVLDSKSGRALIIGGLASSGVYAKRISVLDIVSFDHKVLSIEGDTVELPALNVAIWDAENDRAVVIGGTAGAADLAQVFAVRVAGDAAIVKRLPDFPPGSAFQPALAYDPIGKRIIVVAHIHAQDPAKELAYRATYALDLRPGAESWSTLVPGEAGPPQVQLGETRQMTFDSARDRMILATSGTKSTLGSAWVLDLRDPKQWKSLAGTFPSRPMVDPALIWDDVSCSFLYFTRTKAACGFDGWRMDMDASFLTSNLLGNAAFASGGPGYGTMLFDAPRDRLLILGGGDCSVSDQFLDTVEIVSIKR